MVLPGPTTTASGCAAAGAELAGFLDLGALGAVVTKSVLLEPRAGRATPRGVETPSGMLNGIGLQGPGVDHLVAVDLPALAAHGARAVVSVAGGSAAEFAEVTRRLRGAPALVAVEVNISCPNVHDRGLVFARRADASAEVVAAVRAQAPDDVPVLAKLAPDVTDVVEIARACVEAGADGLVCSNTLLGVVVDVEARRPALSGTTGGLSGPAMRAVAVRATWQVHAALPDLPLLGAGGVRTRPGRAGAGDGRRAGRAGRHGDVRRPDGAGPRRRRGRGVAGRAGRGAAGRPRRRRAPPAPARPGAVPGRRRRGVGVSVGPWARRWPWPGDVAPVAVALDRPDLTGALDLAQAVGPHVAVVKVGLELFVAAGPEAVDAVAVAAGRPVFLDLKLADIPATVAGAAAAAARTRPALLTVHALAGEAAVAAAVQAAPDVLVTAVTVLTSLDGAVLDRLGVAGPPRDAVRRLAVLAVGAGARALVCSPQEVGALRAEVGADVALVVPGVRPAGAVAGDQARTATPEAALADGADLLVVGRPVTAAPDPAAAAARLPGGATPPVR